MNGVQFDVLARELCDGFNRRRMLMGFGAVALVEGAARRPEDRAALVGTDESVGVRSEAAGALVVGTPEL